MKISLFMIGLILCIIGTSWIVIEFSQAQKVYDKFTLGTMSHEVMQSLRGNDIGFYKIFISEYSDEKIFFQILDRKHNVISEEVIQTKMSVGYFDYVTEGDYYAKATNISKNQVKVEMEFGETNSKGMIPGGIVVLAGSIIILFTSYINLRNYKIAQPDENNS